MADNPKSSKAAEQPYDTESEESFDAKVLSEQIQEGEQNAANINIEGDYAASKQFSQPQGSDDSKASGSPDQFRDMAKQIKRR